MLIHKFGACCFLVTLFLVNILLGGSNACAEPRYDKFGGLIERGAIEKHGVIDAINEISKGIVFIIDDTEYRIMPGARLYTSYGSQASPAIFKTGMSVMFFANKRKISNMWPEDVSGEELPIPAKEQKKGAAGAKHDTIYKEGGAWKN